VTLTEKILLYEKWLISSKAIDLNDWNTIITQFKISKDRKLRKGDKVYV